MVNRKRGDCKFFLPYSKVCSAPSEYESPPAPAISCIHPKDPSKCPVKEYYADPGPYVLGENISLREFLQRKRSEA